MASRDASPEKAKGAGVVAAVLVILAGTNPGFGAVRLCEATISVGPVTAASEREARKAALDAWKTKALEHGEPYASWRLAAGKLLKCLPRPGRGFECVARASPCTIEQAPDRRELRRKRIGV